MQTLDKSKAETADVETRMKNYNDKKLNLERRRQTLADEEAELLKLIEETKKNNQKELDELAKTHRSELIMLDGNEHGLNSDLQNHVDDIKR